MKKSLFLDRDGVVCEVLAPEVFLVNLEQFKLRNGIQELVRVVKNKGYTVVVVTSQPQLAMGMLTLKELQAIHEHMRKALKEAIDGIYVCPHDRSGSCACRKPKPGLLLQAAKDLNIDLAQSIFVGDRHKDVLAGQAAGCKTVLVKSEHWPDELMYCKPDMFADRLTNVIPLLI